MPLMWTYVDLLQPLTFVEGCLRLQMEGLSTDGRERAFSSRE